MLGILLIFGLVGIVAKRPLKSLHLLKDVARAVLPSLAIFAILVGYYAWSLLFAKGHLNGPVYPANLLQSYRSDLLEPIVPTIYQYIAPLALATTSFRFVAGNLSENAGYLRLSPSYSRSALHWR